MLHCNLCTSVTSSLQQHLEHYKLHETTCAKFVCGFLDCRRTFNKKSSLLTHYIKIHQLSIMKDIRKILDRPNSSGKYTCSDLNCRTELTTLYNLIKHMKEHIRDGLTILCPFDDCKSTYQKVRSFSSHISRCHYRVKKVANNVEPGPLIQLENTVDNYSAESELGTESFEDITFCDTVDQNNFQTDENLKDVFLDNLACFFVKIEHQLKVAGSTADLIASQITTLHELGEKKIKLVLLPTLKNYGLSSYDSNNILNKVLECHPFRAMSELQTTHIRRAYCRENFPYVHPHQIKLKIKKCPQAMFHYVPINETLQKNFDCPFFYKKLMFNNEKRQTEILSDFTDGIVFKKNIFFRENPNGLKLILYQDSFEVANPIGSAKKKYKILAVYLSIGNLPHYLRYRINSIQLVALCRETYFDHEQVYGKIVDDLKHLETVGITLRSGEVLKGALVFIAGDNLGSHALGGFTENFSKCSHICRYCTATRIEFYSENGELITFDKRTEESYKDVLEKIKIRKLNNKKNKIVPNNINGIKFDSVFNRLEYYHVCKPGLPPCLGHDIFECLICYDLKLFLDDLIQNKKWFAPSKHPYTLLNDRIDSFPYCTEDRRDKPCTISRLNMKITGGAWQLWTFLRLLPLIIYDKIKDSDDSSWRAILILTEIIEIVIAPEIHISYLPILASLINEYISLRKMFLEPLRPKHHYLTHYPELILEFGPLMKVWTLRFESKHTFFKQYVHSIKNFRNVTKSLSESHELFQSYVRKNDEPESEVEIGDGKNFNIRDFNNEIKNVIQSASITDSYQDYDKLTIKGVSYKKGDALFVSGVYEYSVEVGRILNILCDDGTKDIFAIVEVLETTFHPDLRAYELESPIRYQCIKFNDLPSNEKLHVYKLHLLHFVKPNYGLVKSAF